MNKVMLIGNVTKDLSLRNAGETKVCNFFLAVNEGYGEKQKTIFPEIVVFGKVAENCVKYLGKGKKCSIEGRIDTGSYENKDGQKVYYTRVIASNVEFLSPAQKKEEGASPATEEPEFSQIADDDIPF